MNDAIHTSESGREILQQMLSHSAERFEKRLIANNAQGIPLHNIAHA